MNYEFVDNGHDKSCAWAWAIREADGYMLNKAKIENRGCSCND